MWVLVIVYRNIGHFWHCRKFYCTVLSFSAPDPLGLILGFSCIQAAFGLSRSSNSFSCCSWMGPPCFSVSTFWLFWSYSVLWSFSHSVDSLCFFSHRCWYCAGHMATVVCLLVFTSLYFEVCRDTLLPNFVENVGHGFWFCYRAALFYMGI